jgi:hypothetical protein
MYLYPIADVLLDDNDEINKANTQLLNKLFNFDSSDMTNNEYKNQVNSILDDLTKDLEKPEEAKK